MTDRLMLQTTALLVVLLTGFAASAAGQVPRAVQAGPDDILSGRLALPAPEAAAMVGRTALLPVTFDGAGRWQAELPVGAAGRLTLALLSPEASAWQVRVGEPGAELRPLPSWVAEGLAGSRVEALSRWPGAELPVFELGTARRGHWTVTIEHEPGAADGLLLVADGGAGRLVSHLRDWRLTADRAVGLLAYAGDDAGLSAGRLQAARASVRVDGAALSVPLHDDGLHGDGGPGDGRFGGSLPPLPPGPVLVVVTGEGLAADGAPFLATNWHLLSVAEPGVALSGQAGLVWPGGVADLEIQLGVSVDDPARRVQAAAELWGRTEAGEAVPVAWVGRIDRVGPGGTLALPVSGQLLKASGAVAGLELRAVRLQDVDSHAVLDRSPRLALVPVPAASTTAPSGAVGPVLDGAPQFGPRQTWDRSLMLVHGYCSGGGVWPPAQFSGPLVEFLDPDQNRSHDAFAQLLVATATAAGKESFGVVGHSQGGQAALHLLTYYQSGLDKSFGGRRIQSVGSPYQGTPLAGALAGIGAVFGAGCGENTDMAPEGAVLWLAGIPTWARAQVHYWTTSNSGSACEFITSLFLGDPEDGTTEKARGQLPGGVDQGHITGWCHTTGMSNPAQYLDAVLNAERDATAAR